MRVKKICYEAASFNGKEGNIEVILNELMHYWKDIDFSVKFPREVCRKKIIKVKMDEQV